MRIKNYDDLDSGDAIPWQHKVQKIGKRRRSKQYAEELIDPRDQPEGAFRPTYIGSRHEMHWILTYLGPLYENHQILDVVRQVKGGKEATVYCCRAHPSAGMELVAAKLYRPRIFRNLRNDAQYRQGRAVLDQRGRAVQDLRSLHAIQRGTVLGKELVHTSWLSHEFHTLRLLHEAGADVPRPISLGENLILMEYLGDERRGAPALRHVTLDTAEAPRLFDRLLRNVDLMLASGRVHGDLSAYNVLYWERRVTIIDFPQAFDPVRNSDAYPLLTRDVTRLCQYFARYGIQTDAPELAHEIWTRHLPAPEELEEAEL
ncbi:MAG TPA: RIO1 family regulatory kinase/ATPase [Chloroflexota bacterium]